MKTMPLIGRGYIVLLHAIVHQLGERVIVSGGEDSTISRLDFAKFPQAIREHFGTLSYLNTSCKVNLNYVTRSDYPGRQIISAPLFHALKRAVMTEYGIVFRSDRDYNVVETFRYMKTVHASIFNVADSGTKMVMHALVQNPKNVVVPYNKDIHGSLGLGPNSLVLKTEDGDMIYSNMAHISDACFFAPGMRMRPLAECKRRIANLLEQNRVFRYVRDECGDNAIIMDYFTRINDAVETSYDGLEKRLAG